MMVWRALSGRSSQALILSALLGFCCCAAVNAQLEITEIMFNPASDDGDWEWIEIRNIGNSPVDLDGYFMDDDDGNAIPEEGLPNIHSVAMGGNAANNRPC